MAPRDTRVARRQPDPEHKREGVCKRQISAEPEYKD